MHEELGVTLTYPDIHSDFRPLRRLRARWE